MSIPASAIVSVTPSVLSAGGNPLALNGLILSDALVLPVGSPLSFPSAASVGTYFGVSSTEAEMAAVYFNGFNNSNTKPAALLFSRYPTTPAAAFCRGGASALTLTQIKAIPTTASMTMVVDGAIMTCTGAVLSGATSPSDAASIITAACTGSTKPTVTYDANFGAFVATSNTTGAMSTIAYGIGNLADTLSLTKASGAILSQGAAIAVPAVAMSAIIPLNQNWVTFASTFEPVIGDKEAFANWVSTGGGRFIYVAWDTDVQAIATPGIANVSFGEWLALNSSSGTAPIYADAANGPLHAAFILGIGASIDFTETNGRITYAFKSNSGLTPYVSDATISENLLENGYNFYGAYATANDTSIWLYNGQISGSYKFIDSYLNAVWLNNSVQLALMTLFANTKSIPYTTLGYGMIRAAVQDPINAALNFGAIRAGVPLSASQIAEVNAAAGLQIDQTLASRGWYFQVTPATALVRSLRQSPPCTLWYMDGESVQTLNIASINIQ